MSEYILTKAEVDEALLRRDCKQSLDVIARAMGKSITAIANALGMRGSENKAKARHHRPVPLKPKPDEDGDRGESPYRTHIEQDKAFQAAMIAAGYARCGPVTDATPFVPMQFARAPTSVLGQSTLAEVAG